MVISLPKEEVLEEAGSCWKEENHPDEGRPLSPNRKPASSFKKVSFNYENWQASKHTWQLNFAKTFALAAKEDLLFCWFHEKKEKKEKERKKHFSVSPQFPLSFFSTKPKVIFQGPCISII